MAMSHDVGDPKITWAVARWSQANLRRCSDSSKSLWLPWAVAPSSTLAPAVGLITGCSSALTKPCITGTVGNHITKKQKTLHKGVKILVTLENYISVEVALRAKLEQRKLDIAKKRNE